MRFVTFENFVAGQKQRQYQYDSFEPAFINHGWRWSDATINVLLEEASGALGELNGLSHIVPNINTFIEMHVVKEAQTSSKIEGTQTSMHEVLLPVEEVHPERKSDWTEVQNYIAAMRLATESLQHIPLSERLIRQAHERLLLGARGEHRQPGQYRTSQNWIGGSSLSDAVFIPPHHESVPRLMADLEKFFHNDEVQVPVLIRAAITHYQFETIHPFLDGNGRIGRLLIVLYLLNTGVLARPTLYLSDFFERNRAQYYNALMRVRENNDLAHWVKFFLNGVITTAKKGTWVFREIFRLRDRVEKQVLSLGRRAQVAHAALQHLYQFPSRTTTELAEALDISLPTAGRLIAELENEGILEEITGMQRNRRWEFTEYIALFE